MAKRLIIYILFERYRVLAVEQTPSRAFQCLVSDFGPDIDKEFKMVDKNTWEFAGYTLKRVFVEV